MPNYPINNQEEWDAAVAAEYGDVAGMQSQITTLTGERDAHATTIAELQGKIKAHETNALKQTIAKKKGIPIEFASRLTGENEKDISADADSMAAMLKAAKGPAPLFDPTPKETDPKKVEISDMLKDLRGE